MSHLPLVLAYAIHNYTLHVTIFVLTITISSIILHYNLKPSSPTPPLPRGPRSLPIIGYLPFFSPDLYKQFTNMSLSYGPIFKFRLGTKLHVVIYTPELARVVTRDHDHTFSNRNLTVAASVITYRGQDIVWSNNNSHWRKLRKIFVHEALSNKNLDACGAFRLDEVRKTIKNIFGKIGTKVDINQVSFLTESNVLTRMILGDTMGERNRDLGADLQRVSMNINEIFGRPNLSDFFPILAWFDLQRVERDMKKQLEMMDQIIEKMIKDRTKSNTNKSKEGACDHEGKKDFLQILLDLKDQEDGTPLPIIHIKALLLDVMLAGTETTTLIEWVMAEIMQNNNVMKRVQEELVQVVGLGNIVEESHLPKLQYLDATIKETLRLHPVVPFLIPRSPSKDCVVSGYTVSKNSTVLLNVWSIHRDPKYWDNPLEFKPKRFLTCQKMKKWYNGNDLKFFPFGSGRRLCPGLPLAEKMSMFITASLLHSFNWSLSKGEMLDLSEKFGITIKKSKSLIAIPSQRLCDSSLYE